MGQLVRALETNGPCAEADLARLDGAPYREAGRFDRALALALADGLVVQGPDAELQASP